MTTEVTLMKPVEADDRGLPNHYKWFVLINTTLAFLLATLDGSIVLISLPEIFRGIGMDPLVPSNSFYLLWMILGFLAVTAVLVVSFGRLGDMFGRVRLFNLGFAIFTFFSLLLTITPMHGTAAAIWLITMRIFQGVGAAMLSANVAAILTDAFPEHQRGMALGINSIAGITGSFVGLVIGGFLAPINWRLIFLISVPIGVIGTLWSYFNLRELPVSREHKVDWPGNLTFAVGLVSLMVAITYGIQPYGGHTMGWTSPFVLGCFAFGIALLVAFVFIERHTEQPMFNLELFRIRPFTGGNIASLLSATARGGLMFTLIIWLQGIWLPLHGYDYESTPLWAGVAMLPVTIGFLMAGPVSGWLSDRFGPRPFAVTGMLLSGFSFLLLMMLPVNFTYWQFAIVLFIGAIGQGLFASPNRAGVMNSLPHQHRGVGGGMNATFQNSGQVFSIGIFFTLIIIGLSASLHTELVQGLLQQGVPLADATKAAHLPAVSTLFASLLGYNPIQHLLGAHTLAGLTPTAHATVISRSFFPSIISGAFHNGLKTACGFSILCCLGAATASFFRGGKFIYQESYEDEPSDSAPFPRDPAFDAEIFMAEPSGPPTKHS
jgi:MFS family permease